MAHITRSIDLPEPVGVISERWEEFERTARCGIAEAAARVRWRAEVLTLEPAGDGTRLTLRVDYDPSAGDGGLSRSIERALAGFRSFLGGFAGTWPGGTAPSGWAS